MSFLERLGIVYKEEIRLKIVTELYMREMGVRQFHESFGGSSYDSVRRHFLTLVEHGWLRKVRTAVVAERGRPEVLFRSTEQTVIDTETWRSIPFSIRDALTGKLLEEMAGRFGERVDDAADSTSDDAIATSRTIELDELGWCRAHAAIENCFQSLKQEQTDAKVRLETNQQAQSFRIVVNLAAFETSGAPSAPGEAGDPLPKPRAGFVPPSWPQRIGKVFADRLDLRIVEELNRAARTPVELLSLIEGTSRGGTTSRNFLRRCRRLSDLGWVVSVDTKTGGPLYGANVQQFRAAAPDLSEASVHARVPSAARNGEDWRAFKSFVETSIGAIDSGHFNSRFDRHLTMSLLLVDEIGWNQISATLLKFEDAVRSVEVEVGRRRDRQGFAGFQAAFYLSTFRCSS